MKQENNSEKKEDSRIHLILYFISGPKPKLNDYSIMKELSKWVNILPVISRGGDPSEYEKIRASKTDFITTLKHYEIEIFDVEEALKVLFSDIRNSLEIKSLLTSFQEENWDVAPLSC